MTATDPSQAPDVQALRLIASALSDIAQALYNLAPDAPQGDYLADSLSVAVTDAGREIANAIVQAATS